MFILPEKKELHHILSKIGRDAEPWDLLDEVGYEFCWLDEEYTKEKGIDGCFSIYEKRIFVNFEYKDSPYNYWDVFSHEFGHLIQDEITNVFYSQEYARRNVIFPQILRNEQISSVIGAEMMDWKFPMKKKENHSRLSYFSEGSISFLKNYYDGIFDVLWEKKI